jgi:small subunit ribosomal protein S18
MAYFTEKKEFNKDRDFKSKDPKKRAVIRQRNTARYQLAKDAIIDYKNVSLLQKYLNERGKIVPRRISGVGAKEQRDLCSAIKQARFLGLLTSGSTRYR